MTTLADRVSSAIAYANTNQVALAAACSIKPPSVNNWVSGETKTMKYKTAILAAKFLGVRIEWLAEGKGPMFTTDAATRIPDISAGLPAPVVQPCPQTLDEMIAAVTAMIAALPLHAEKYKLGQLEFQIAEHRIAQGCDNPWPSQQTIPVKKAARSG